MAGDDGGELLFPAEPAAGFHLDDADAILRQIEEPGERVVDVVRALHGAPHGDAVFRAGDGEHAVRLDVELLLRAALVLPFDDDRRSGDRRLDVTLGYAVALEDVVGSPDDLASGERVVDGQDRRQRFDLNRNLPPRIVGPRAIAMRDQHDRLLGMIHDIRREVGLVVDDQLDEIVAGDVGGGDDDEVGPIDRRIEGDLLDAAARNWGGRSRRRIPRRIVHMQAWPVTLSPSCAYRATDSTFVTETVTRPIGNFRRGNASLNQDKSAIQDRGLPEDRGQARIDRLRPFVGKSEDDDAWFLENSQGEHVTEVEIEGKHHRGFRASSVSDFRVRRSLHAERPDVHYLVAELAEEGHRAGRNPSVGEKSHRSRTKWMDFVLRERGSVSEGLPHIFLLEIRQISHNLRGGHPVGHQIEDVRN